MPARFSQAGSASEVSDHDAAIAGSAPGARRGALQAQRAVIVGFVSGNGGDLETIGEWVARTGGNPASSFPLLNGTPR